MKIPGIYTIECLANNKLYVGKTKNLKTRYREHISKLRRGIHWNFHLQRAYNKYGEENMIYNTLIECEERFLYSEEHYWVTMLDTLNIKYGYNIRPTHPSNHASPTTTENRWKMGVAHKKPLIVLNTNGEFIARYESGRQAAKDLNIGRQQVYETASGKYRHHKNLQFIYEENYDSSVNHYIDSRWIGIAVIMYNNDLNMIKEFASLSEAARFMNSSISPIKRAIDKNLPFKNYIWKIGHQRRQ